MKHLSLFSGIGGLDIAAEKAGFETVCFVEIDEYCQKILRKHWPEVSIIKDVRNVNKEIVNSGQSVELISGGFPCQDVSTAGSRKGLNEYTRSGLWGEYCRIIGEIRPEWALVENVRGLLSIDFGRGFGRVLGDLARLRYDAFWGVLRASQIGAWHQRERVFIIAYPEYKRKLANELENKIREGISNSTKQWPSIGSFGLFDAHGYSGPRLLGDIRVDNGLPNLMDRIKCLGNAVVPQLAYILFQAIAEIEKQTK